MNQAEKIVHVSQSVLLEALEAAFVQRTQQAAAIYIQPSNSRAYGCCVAGCTRPAYAKGHCNAHYIRMRQGLPMETPVRARKRESLCAICGAACGGKGGWGMCPKHHRQARYETLKDAAVAAFGGRCMQCHGAFHRCVFDFHHYGDKEGSPSDMFVNNSLSTIALELSKCKLLCANCHRLEHCNELRPRIREADLP